MDGLRFHCLPGAQFLLKRGKHLISPLGGTIPHVPRRPYHSTKERKMIQLQKRTLQPYGHKLGVMAYGFEFDVDGFVGDAKKLVKDLSAGKMEGGNIRTAESRTTFTISAGIGRRSSSDPVHDYGDSNWVEYSVGPLSITHVSAPRSGGGSGSSSPSRGYGSSPSDYYDR